jgi:hypothetical protein
MAIILQAFLLSTLRLGHHSRTGKRKVSTAGAGHLVAAFRSQREEMHCSLQPTIIRAMRSSFSVVYPRIMKQLECELMVSTPCRWEAAVLPSPQRVKSQYCPCSNSHLILVLSNELPKGQCQLLLFPMMIFLSSPIEWNARIIAVGLVRPWIALPVSTYVRPPRKSGHCRH